MNYALQGTASHVTPRREEPLTGSGAIPVRQVAGRPSIATRTLPHAVSGLRAALSHRRRTGGLPGPSRRASAGSGLGPIASGASRGVAILVSR